MSTGRRTRMRTGRFLWTPEQFQKAAEDGWFGDRKVELLDGDVYYKVRNPPHRDCVSNLDELLRQILPASQWTVTKEDDIEMGDAWIPSPDIAVLRGHHDLYKDERLQAVNVALLVEVSYPDLHSGSGLEVDPVRSQQDPDLLDR